MGMNFTRRDQASMLQLALGLTHSLAWRSDALAIGGYNAAGDLAVIAVFQEFYGTEAEMHLATVNGHLINRTTMAAFSQIGFSPSCLNLTRVWVSIAADNPRAQASAIRAGFEFEYRKRSGFLGHKDAIVLSIHRPTPDAVRSADANEHHTFNKEMR